jgi:hypothetical protein
MIREVLDQAEGEPDRLLLHIDQWKELYTGLLLVDRHCRWRDALSAIPLEVARYRCGGIGKRSTQGGPPATGKLRSIQRLER